MCTTKLHGHVTMLISRQTWRMVFAGHNVTFNKKECHKNTSFYIPLKKKKNLLPRKVWHDFFFPTWNIYLTIIERILLDFCLHLEYYHMSCCSVFKTLYTHTFFLFQW